MARRHSAHPLLLALMAALAMIAAGRAALAEGIVFHVANRCPFPVWPASAPNTGHPVLAGGGFFLEPGRTRRVAAPASWNGRFWARTGCNFTANVNGAATAACLTGDCEGRLACNGSAGAPPATLVEVDIRGEDASSKQRRRSSYDVSVVDGYNLPVSVSPHPANAIDKKTCAIAGCVKDVNAACPPELQVTAGSKVVACRSACLAFGLDAFCCRGAYATPAACRGSVYSRLFKDACPAYYSYAYDATAATATGCYAGEYVITFCPNRWGDEETTDRVAQI